MKSPTEFLDRGQGIFIFGLGHEVPRPAIILWYEADRYLLLPGSSQPPKSEAHVCIAPTSRTGRLLQLSKVTFFEARWCKIILHKKLMRDLSHCAGRCPPDILQALDRVIDGRYWRAFSEPPLSTDSEPAPPPLNAPLMRPPAQPFEEASLPFVAEGARRSLS